MEMKQTLKSKIADEKIVLKRHAGFNLVGKYAMTDEQKEEWIRNAIESTEVTLKALKEMLEERDFH